MKKALLFCSIAIFLATNLFAQNDDTRSFRLGMKAAPTLAWLKTTAEHYEGNGSGLGFGWGASGEFLFSDNLAFVTGFNVTYTGGKLKFPHVQTVINVLDTGILSRSYNIKYLEIPLAFKGKTRQIGFLKYYGTIGLGSSFRLSAKANDDFTPSMGNQVISQDKIDIKKEVSFFRESLLIGLGVEYPLGGSTAIFGGFTFNNGFTDILKGVNKKDPNINQNAFSNYIELNIGILF